MEQHFPTRPVDREKAEHDLALNIKKATSPEETAPKQKHVRKCIVYTWDYHTSESIWTGLKVQPIIADEVQTFKALIAVHKIIRGGHPITLKQAQNQTHWLETCARSVVSGATRGYGTLIRAYVDFLKTKLGYHKIHPEFNGNFDYEDYVSLKNVDDPNEGYETINDLMNLQDQIDQFQKLIFVQFRPSSNNECRIAALVPLVEESYGIYKFLTSMLKAMHQHTDAVDALTPLRTRYNAQHYALLKFYYECSNLKYLTSLISDPPSLIDGGAPSSLPKRVQSKSPAPSTTSEPETVAEILKENERQQHELERQRHLQYRLNQERERLAREQLLREQMQRQAEGRVAELERELLNLRQHIDRDKMIMDQYDRKVKAFENDMNQLTLNAQQQIASKDDVIKNLQDQIIMWRNKYESLAKLYSQLRQEHLDLINKFKVAQLKANSAQESIDKLERMEKDMRSKNLELADMIRERDRARHELDKLKNLEKVRRELSEANYRSEDAIRNQREELERMKRELSEAKYKAENTLRAKDEEIAIMQAAMDQSMLLVADMQKTSIDPEKYQNKVDTLMLDNLKNLNEILDSIFQTCIQKIDDGLYELESPMQVGNQNCTPEYTLSMIENGTSEASEFTYAFIEFLKTDRTKNHADVIKNALNFSQAASDILRTVKGITRYADDEDEFVDEIVSAAKVAAVVSQKYLLNVQSFKMDSLPASGRSETVLKCDIDVQDSLQKIAKITEGLLKHNLDVTKRADGEVGNLVEQEMMNAAKVIEAATARIQSLMSQPRDAGLSATELNVHDAILESSLAITNAIAHLIKCATDSQLEIVAQGKGSSSHAAFYKKHNRWTEGLISAAKAIALATNLLIETADGVIHKTHNLEQLIVASNEVAAATAQLVAASRVKADFMSKAQDRLEAASKAVTNACKALVKAVKAIAAKQLEEKDHAIDYASLTPHDYKKQEMEQQVEILKLEKELTNSRRKLAEMRKVGYHAEED
nr:6906_t:CDS:10 [Entrophospora candida]